MASQTTTTKLHVAAAAVKHGGVEWREVTQYDICPIRERVVKSYAATQYHNPHDTSIGGDLDTDPALRFRIGGSS